MYMYAHNRVNGNDKLLLEYLRGTGGVYPQPISNAIDTALDAVNKATPVLHKLIAQKEDADAEREAMAELDLEMGITRSSDEQRGLRIQSRRHSQSQAFKQESRLLKQWNEEICPELARHLDSLYDACKNTGIPQHITSTVEHFCCQLSDLGRMADGDLDCGLTLNDRLEFLEWDLRDFLKDLQNFPQANFMQLLREHLHLGTCNTLAELPDLPTRSELLCLKGCDALAELQLPPSPLPTQP